MGIFDGISKLFNVSKQAPQGLFNFVFNKEAPSFGYGNYKKAYLSWVYACTSVIAEQVANMELRLMKREKDGTSKEITDHPALIPLYKVNPAMTSSDLLIDTQSHLELTGDAFWVVTYSLSGKTPLELYPVDPAKVTVVKDTQKIVGGYIYTTADGKEFTYDTKHMIHFKRFNPNNMYRGMGTVEASASAIDVDTYASKWNRNFFFNSAMPSGTLEVPAKLSDEQFKRVKEQWGSRFTGVENAHKLAILEDGAKFTKISLTQQEMDFLETRKFTRDEIMAMFRVPKSVLGIVEDVNRANAEATEVIFARWVIKPRMQFIVDRLNEFYLPLFGIDTNDYYFTFDDPVPENTELELKKNSTALGNAPWKTINEVRGQDGLEPINGGDVLLVPFSLSPMGSSKVDDDPSEGKGINNIEEAQETIISKEIKVKKKKLGKSSIEFLKALSKESKKKLSSEQFISKRVSFIKSQINDAKSKYLDILLGQKSEILKRLSGKKSRQSDLLKLIFEGFDGEWTDKLNDTNREVLQTALLFSGKQILSRMDIGVNFDLSNPRVVEWLTDHALQHAKLIVGTAKDEVKARVIAGVDNGDSVNQIAESIRTFFDEQAEYRAERMARTEVIAGYAEGSLEGMRQSGIVKLKRWMTANDDRVDDECLINQADGPIGLNDLFTTGHSAPPVHPNCRCDLQEVMD